VSLSSSSVSSGTGKTTSESNLDGRAWSQPTPGYRGLPKGRGPNHRTGPLNDGVIFQNYSLMPWLTVQGMSGLPLIRCSRPVQGKRAGGQGSITYVQHGGGPVPIPPRAAPRGTVRWLRQSGFNVGACAWRWTPKWLCLDEPLSALDGP